MSWKTGVQSKLGIESLEDRLLLAGDVSVRVEGDTLVIRGDSDDNSILIEQGNREGTFVVTGLRNADEGDGDEGTIINRNGRNGTQNSEVRRTFRNIEHIMINMGAGDDEVFINGISESRSVGSRSAGPLEGNLHVNLGAGDDTLRIGTLFRAGVADGVAFDDDGNPIGGNGGGTTETPLTEDQLGFDDDGNVLTDDDGNVLDADGNPILISDGDGGTRNLTEDDLQTDFSVDDGEDGEGDTGFVLDDDGNAIVPTDEFGDPILDDDNNEVEGILFEDLIIDEDTGEITDADGNPIFFVNAEGEVDQLAADDLGTDFFTDDDGTLLDADGNPIVVVTEGNGGADAVLVTSGGDEVEPTLNRAGEVVNAVSVSRDVRIYGGSGDDDLEIVDFSVGRHLTIDTGAGDDSLVARQSDDPSKPSITVFGNAHIRMGGGDDTVVVTNARFRKTVHVDGGSGFDVIVTEGNSYARSPHRNGFESTDSDDAFGGDGINDGDDDDNDN